jgi:hypothetical protein
LYYCKILPPVSYINKKTKKLKVSNTSKNIREQRVNFRSQKPPSPENQRANAKKSDQEPYYQ